MRVRPAFLVVVVTEGVESDCRAVVRAVAAVARRLAVATDAAGAGPRVRSLPFLAGCARPRGGGEGLGEGGMDGRGEG